MPHLPAKFKSTVFAFALAATTALFFALYTQHVWEDYYITYRSSKNLATGHGLVFNHGDRLHTFTSPLGVLLPAAAALLAANASDDAALWIFRGMSIAAFGGAAALLIALARIRRWAAPAGGLLLLLVISDAKSLDFTINGMETGFMLLFLAYALWAHFSAKPRQWMHLGAAWAGLMWTRPDSFIYIGLLAAACWIFNQPAHTGGDRLQQLRLFLKAGLLTTALYGPWLVWAWWYYGTAVPHTIVAKGVQSGGLHAWERFREHFWQLPWLIWRETTAAPASFLPSYYDFPKWPWWMLSFGRVLSTVSCLLWIVPRLRLEARIASLAYFMAAAYLSFVPYYPFPWYLPPTTLLAYLALAGALEQVWTGAPRPAHWIIGAIAGMGLAAAITLTVGSARQMRAQQRLVEDGNRRVIGEWLRDQAQPGDTVFMEPLGYIGFFSGLKTYDWPGMSAREMPRARHLVGPNWGSIILYLQPNWLVLRAGGDGDLPKISPALDAYGYERVRDFNRRSEIEALDVPGRGLLEFDAHFVLYRRKVAFRQDADGYEIASPVASSSQELFGRPMRLVHAPGILACPLPTTARSLEIAYGMPDGAAEEPHASDGARFEVWLVDGSHRQLLHEHLLAPRANPSDRGPQTLTLDLPPRRHPTATLVFVTDPNASVTKDWTFWSNPMLK